jgi:spore germination protein KC
VAGHVGSENRNMVTFSTNREKYMQFDKPFGSQKLMLLEGSAVFRGCSFVGFLSDIETRGFLWVADKTKTGTLAVAKYGGKGILSAETIGSKSSIEPEVAEDKISFKVKVEAECRLSESEERIDLNSTNTIKNAERALAESIKREMETAVKKAQKEYKSDIFGFGNTLYKKKPEVWKTIKDQWKELYPEVEVSYEVKVTLKRMGETQNGIKAKR